MVVVEAFRNLLITSAPIDSTTLETEVDRNTEKKYTSKGCPNLCCRRTELPVYTEYKEPQEEQLLNDHAQENVNDNANKNSISLERGMRLLRMTVSDMFGVFKLVKEQKNLTTEEQAPKDEREVIGNEFFPKDSEKSFDTSLWAIFNL